MNCCGVGEICLLVYSNGCGFVRTLYRQRGIANHLDFLKQYRFTVQSIEQHDTTIHCFEFWITSLPVCFLLVIKTV